MNIWQRLFFNEPTALVSVLRLCIAAAVTFGLSWTPEQQLVFLAAIEGGLLYINRALVTSNKVAEARVDAGSRPTVPLDEGRVVKPLHGPSPIRRKPKRDSDDPLGTLD